MLRVASNFNDLVNKIQSTHKTLQTQTIKAVNIGLTIRNWLTGFYILEFEQNGHDRAEYGSALLARIAEKTKIKGLTAPELSRCRQFYKTYSDIFGSITQKSHLTKKINDNNDFMLTDILGSSTQKLGILNNIEETDLKNHIISAISYTHFVELIKIDAPVKRKYYEMLTIKTQLSVKELKREISSLSYERLGLSENKEKALEQISHKLNPSKPKDIIKSSYFFEFLGINSPELIEETELEQALIDNLQRFIIELGNGFCFEARQKRILIGEEYFFIDIVFYHRILKCHILIELKVDSFNHSHASQLVTYLNYYRKNIMEPGDNPPIGILLVTDKNSALVEYATANEKDSLFVSKYKLKLPSENELKTFIEKKLEDNQLNIIEEEC